MSLKKPFSKAKIYTVVFTAVLALQVSFAGTIDPDSDGHKHAWSENTGWLNFAPGTGPGVTVSSRALTGYAWSENCGWINLSPAQYGGVFHDGDGVLYGYGWSESAGWISFSCQNADPDSCDTVDYGVTIDLSTGRFLGRAWGENIGWITFDHRYDTLHGVKTGVPNLTAVKTDSVSGVANIQSEWEWHVDIENTGDGDAEFADGQTIFVDALPVEGLTYWPAVVSEEEGIEGDGTISCSFPTPEKNKTLTCIASGGPVTLKPSGGFRISVTAESSTTGEKINPTGGLCMVDPDNHLAESDENDNDCYDKVTVVAPDLSVTKSNSVSGAATLGDSSSWDWHLDVSNDGDGPANFEMTQVILTDELPSDGMSYSGATISGKTGVSGPGDISCELSGHAIECFASDGDVSIEPSGGFRVTIVATASSSGVKTNPADGGICRTDPNDEIHESDESNNDCSDTVTVSAPNLRAVKSNDVNGATRLGYTWNWQVDIDNAGDSDAVFTDGQTIFKDEMPTDGVRYAPDAVVSNMVDVDGPVSCAMGVPNANTVVCVADGDTVAIAPSGGFRVSVVATPTTMGTKINPSGGPCQVDPENVIMESDKTDNICQDIVTVSQAPDIYYVEPLKVCGFKTPCFEKISDAIDAAYNGPLIRIAEGDYDENIVLDVEAVLEFGWNADFDRQPETARPEASLNGWPQP